MFLGRLMSGAVLAGALALAACSGGTNSASGNAAMVPAAGANHASQSSRWTVVNVRSNKRTPTCNTAVFNAGCYTFSQANGLEIDWCFGTPSKPCAQTSGYTNYGGDVFRISNGMTAKRIKVTWSGPTQCDPDHCNGSSDGSYIKDAMVSGKKPPALQRKYSKGQYWLPCMASFCNDGLYAGINVGP